MVGTSTMPSDRALEEHLVETLHDVIDAVTGKSTTEKALTGILESAATLLHADAGSLQVVGVDDHNLALAADFQLPDGFRSQFNELSSMPGSVFQRACDSQEQIVIVDADTLTSDSADRRIFEHGGFAAMHVTPLIGGDGKCAGLLALYFEKPLALGNEEGDVINLLARQALTVIQHRRQRSRLVDLVQALRQRTKQLETSERKLTVQTAELRAIDESRESFISMLGHELRNPLAAILNSLELIGLAREERGGGKQAGTLDRALGVITRQSRHLGRLIDDLLDINRLSRGKLQLRLETFDIQKCIDEIVNAARPKIRKRGLTLQVSTASDPMHVLADPERVAQILDNLLRNAIGFTSNGGELFIETRRETCFAAISIRDTGVGMDQQQLQKLFASDEPRPAGAIDGGLGLGLTLVRQLVELHGGAVTAYSAGAGKGSEFTVRLPITAHAIVSDNASGLAEIELPDVHRVLVVDDKPDNADALSAVLLRIGQKVETAYSGESALETARQFSPDVAFLDLSMPVMDGYELAEKLRAQFACEELTLIALTGQPYMQQSPLFDHHLIKPMRAERLIELLNRIDAAP